MTPTPTPPLKGRGLKAATSSPHPKAAARLQGTLSADKQELPALIDPRATHRPLAYRGASDDRAAMTEASSARTRPAALSRWLWVVALLVIAIVAVGGITRLTESGLSITEWKPVSGILPPLSDAAWQAEFEKFKQN